MAEDKYEKIFRLAKRRGFFWPAYEIYGGVGGLLDFGPLGASLKRNVEEKWRNTFVRKFGFFEIETPTVSPSQVFEASGHAEHFTDKMVECTKCGRKWRADHIVQEQTRESVEHLSIDELDNFISRRNVRCPECGGKFGKPRFFNLMFKTTIGPYAEKVDYLRPETAQAMFTNFKRLYEFGRRKLPLTVAQIGRCLRNEISPRQGPIRLREFTIMEFEHFFDPDEPSCPFLREVKDKVIPLLPMIDEAKKAEKILHMTVEEALKKDYIKTEWLAYFMTISIDFVSSLGIPFEKQRLDEKPPWERAHYSAQTYDHEVLCERWGWIEVAGLSYRTDYDLGMHMEKSGADLTVTKEGRKFIPHVVEPSYGSDRLVYATLEHAYSERNGRIVLRLPRDIAPIQVAVFPLVSKDGLPEYSLRVYEMLKREGFSVEYDDSGYIGRRYARADEIGVPLAITIDYQTLKDDSVTIRDRDTWDQVRNKTSVLPGLLKDFFTGKVNFEQLGYK